MASSGCHESDTPPTAGPPHDGREFVLSLRHEVAAFQDRMESKLDELEAAFATKLYIHRSVETEGEEKEAEEDLFAVRAIEPNAILKLREHGQPDDLAWDTLRLYASCTHAGGSENKARLHGRWMELSTQLSSVLANIYSRHASNAVIEGSRSVTFRLRMKERWVDKPLHPEGSFRIAWDSLALFLVILDGFLTPIAIAWDLPMAGSGVLQTSFWSSFLFWFLDILLNFNTAVYVRGNLLFSRLTIAWHYLKTWLVFDLLLILLDCVTAFSTVSDLSALRVARLVRGLRLVRLLKMSRLHDMIQEVAASSGRQWIMLVIAIASTTCRILVVAHILACIWIWVGRLVDESGATSWIQISGATTLSIWVQYLHSLRYVMNSPSPPAIAPDSATERLFDILAYMFSLLVIGSAISAIAGTVNDLRAMNEARARQRREIRLYLTSQNARYELVARVMKFVDYKLEKMTSVNFDQSLISPTLYTELFVGQRGKFLSKLPIFSLAFEIFPDIFAHVCTGLEKHVYEKGELVFSAGAWAGFLYMTTAGYFIHSDVVVNGEHEDKLLKGDEVHWFAEISLYADSAIHASTLRAKNIAEMFTLSGQTLIMAVRENPACAAMFCEYARDYVAMQRGMKDRHADQVSYAQTCCKKTQYFQELHPDQRKLLENIDVVKSLSNLQSPAAEASSQLSVEVKIGPPSKRSKESPGRADDGVHSPCTQASLEDVVGKLASGAVSTDEMSRQLQQYLPELHPELGTYRIFEETGERGRAESACISTLALLGNRYDIYTAPQASGQLSQLQWEQLQDIVAWTEPTDRQVHAVLTLLAIRGLGKSKSLVSQVPEQDQQPEKAVLHLINYRDNVVPSVRTLDDEMHGLIQDTLLHHEAFKLAQMLQGENVPASIAELQERFSNSSNSQKSFRFYILFLLGFMSGIAGGLGSRFMTASNAEAVIACVCMLQRLLDAKPLAIYWGYLCGRAGTMGLPRTTAEDLALVRLACLSRLQDRDGYVALRRCWRACSREERSWLVRHCLADGVVERALVLEFLPDCISNAKNNKLLGLTLLLRVLVDLLANLTVAIESAPNMKSKTLIRVDLSDMAAFTAAVQNAFVFRTCISRCFFHVGEKGAQVQMTSENWGRTQDSESDTTNLSRSMREVLAQQQAVMSHFSIQQAPSWAWTHPLPKSGIREVAC